VKESNKKRKSARLSVPQWQIPPGLTIGNFDYTNSASIAAEYDQFLSGNELNRIDGEVFRRYLPSPGDGPPQGPVVADFGCGNGRSLLPLLATGYRGIGIDLSLPMLESFANKAQQASLSERVGLVKSTSGSVFETCPPDVESRSAVRTSRPQQFVSNSTIRRATFSHVITVESMYRKTRVRRSHGNLSWSQKHVHPQFPSRRA